MKNPWLWRRDGVGWGRVCIRGTGIQAAVEKLAADYGLPHFHIIAAINFALELRVARALLEALEDEQ